MKLTKCILAFALGVFCCAYSLYGQSKIKKFVRENSVALNSENALLIKDNDLSFLDNIAKEHRIIFLGESTHCDSITPVIKAKMVEYLYQKHGFDVLCFESDFFSINEIWQRTNDKTKIDTGFIDTNITYMFTKPNVYNNVFDILLPYTRENSRGLILSGFDNQIGGQHFKQLFPVIISKYLERVERENNIKFSGVDLEFLKNLDSIYFYEPSKVDTNQLRLIETSITRILSNLNVIGDFKNNFEYIALENLGSLCQMNLSAIQSSSDINGFNIRDKQMANNIYWIANVLYPSKKIIIWTHNIHAMYNTSYAYPGYISIAERLKNTSLQNGIYSIGFTSRNLYTCMWPSDTILYLFSSKRKGLIESYFPLKEFYYLNLKKQNNEVIRSYIFRSNLTVDGYYSKWFKGFDGIFYIKTLYPTTF